ncbi:MAG: hypothetical protein ACFFDF_13255 [Candidatus Odinarchaeota archaeon]
MDVKKGIIIRDKNTPRASKKELKSVLSSLEAVNSVYYCNSTARAIQIIEEKYKELSFIYLLNPIPEMEKDTYDFIEFVTKNEHYKHIEFYARLPKKKRRNKYNWYDDFINYIKL